MEIETIRTFVKVVQLGSFSKAADLLRLPKSSVSRAVSRLEEETGTKLLLRTTRSLKLTASGRAFYEACLGPVQSLEEARKSLQGQDSIVSGVVRITAPEDLGAHVISPEIGRLTRDNPELSFEILYTDEVVDLVLQGIDLAVRIGKLSSSRFKAKKLGEVVLVPVAAPAYLEGREKIREPGDLSQHDCLTYTPQASVTRWTMRSKKSSVSVVIRARVVANQMTSLLAMAVQGAGVAFVPNYLCEPLFRSGKLVRLLPEWSAPGLPVSLVSPLATSSSARLKLVSDQLARAVAKALG